MIPLFDDRRREADLDDEIRSHIEMAIADRMARGESRAEAELAARREFGNVAHVKEVTRGSWGGRWLAQFARDVRFGIRSLARARAFTAVAVVTIGLGIGTNAAMFSVVNAVLLRPLPFAESERYVLVRTSFPRDPARPMGGNAYANFGDWRANSRTIEDFIGWHFQLPIITGDSGFEAGHAMVVTGNFFRFLGRAPSLGRGLVEADTAEAAPPVVVLSDGLWRDRFSASDSVVGRFLTLDGVPHQVVGVMPRDFTMALDAKQTPQMWVPLKAPAHYRTNRHASNLRVVGRLAPRATPDQATAELQMLMDRIGEGMQFRTMSVVPLHETVVSELRGALLALLGAVGLVLLIACANVANLLLARAAAIRRDVAVRMALGASRSQIVRQFLAESLILAVSGAVLGTAVAWWGVRALVGFAPESLPLRSGIPIDMRVFLFLTAVSVASSLLFGLAPAIDASATRVRDSLVGTGTRTTPGPTHQRRRDALVVAQIALSFILLVGAGLMIRTFSVLRSTGLSLEPRGLVVAVLNLPSGRFGSTPPEVASRLVDPLLHRLNATPGVRSAAVTGRVPLDGPGNISAPYSFDGRKTRDSLPFAIRLRVTPNYFSTLGIPILRGRSLTDEDSRPGGNAVLVNEAFARAEFGNENPLGQGIRLGSPFRWEIVGVVKDVPQETPGEKADPAIYVNYNYALNAGPPALDKVVVAVHTLDEATVARIRAAIVEAAPGVAISSIRTMDEVVEKSLASRRLNLWLSGIFAGIAVLLAASGLYAVLAYLVAQRTKEIGIRMALGADRGVIIGMMLRRGSVLAALGIAGGIVGASAASRLISALLYGVEPHDGMTYAGVILLLSCAAILSSWVPARRAAGVDPNAALRAE